MKNLIKPLIVMSFAVMCSGLVPGVHIAMAIIGLVSTLSILLSGIFMLGSEDTNYMNQLELIRLEHKVAKEMNDLHAKKLEELENRVSKALAENRALEGRLR